MNSGDIRVAGTTITMQMIVNVTSVPAAVRVVGTGLGVILGSGNTASILIVKLS